ncbi:universal stress protein [Cupriavidus pinatubonensis]|uniref:universal stress protein n=1 Tax=Cupriavidus pinatubonensis TaxID=248026 RepID=UPI00360B72EA
MSLFSRVLLCYDGSRDGRRALRYGAELARRLEAEAHLLAVLEHAHWIEGFDALAGEARMVEEQSAREILREGVARLKACGIETTGHFAIGSPIEQIARMSNALRVDLIVVGHSRCGVLKRWWAANGNGLLLDKVSCSVLVAIDQGDAEAGDG